MTGLRAPPLAELGSAPDGANIKPPFEMGVSDFEGGSQGSI